MKDKLEGTQEESNNNDHKIGKKQISQLRRSSMHYVRSRDQLLEEDMKHFEDLHHKIVKTRRTKIAATISDMYNSYEDLKTMVQVGVNSFMVNMAYCTPDLLTNLRQHRDALEKEYEIYLPITCVLKGTLVRIGSLTKAEIFLRQGQEYRMVVNPKVLGNNIFCAVDDKEITKRVRVGSQILIDYGRVSMTIQRIEKSNESIRLLKEKHQYMHDDFTESFAQKKKKAYPKICLINSSLNDIDKSPVDYLLEQDQFQPLYSDTQLDEFHHHRTDQKPARKKSPSFQALSDINKKDSREPLSKSLVLDNSRANFQEHQSKHPIQFDLSPESHHASLFAPLGHVSKEDNGHQNRFAEQLRQKKQGKKKIYDVLVCTVDSDCILKPFKPIFIYEKEMQLKKQHLKKYAYMPQQEGETEAIESIGEQPSEDEDIQNLDGEECITPKDITDINLCLNNDIDCICVSNARSARDLKAVRSLIGDDRGVRIVAKIQTPESVDNFEEIVRESDGIQIARGYLTVHIPVEKLFAKQKEMIHKCHEHLKPVFISCNILDSMVTSLLPTMCEVGEISNLVSDYVDNIVLSSETSCGNHPIEAIQTLSRICVEAEALRIMRRMQNPLHSDIVTIKSSKNEISSCIINCALQAAYQINATVIIVFTSRGYSALKLSKLRPPCPIIAVTCNKKIARNLAQVSAVNSVLFDNLIGTEDLVKKVITKYKATGLLKQLDIIIITSGDIENVANQTNNIRIYTVQ